jgi:hypothetical protein
MEYVSPIDERVRDRIPHADRPSSLEGKRVALLDITKARGSEFLDRVEQRLREHGAQTFRISKEIFSKPASVDVIEEIALRGDLTVEGLGD